MNFTHDSSYLAEVSQEPSVDGVLDPADPILNLDCFLRLELTLFSLHTCHRTAHDFEDKISSTYLSEKFVSVSFIQCNKHYVSSVLILTVQVTTKVIAAFEIQFGVRKYDYFHTF